MPERRPLPPIAWPITALREAYARGELSPEEVLADALARLQAANPHLHAFITSLSDLAHHQAVAAAEAYRSGTAGPLAGIPISIKDTFDVAGAVSTRGSLIYRSHVAQHDSGAVRRLRAAGAVFVGKTNTAEFGQSATTANRLGEECRNPWNTGRTPGGSSGGAAASVAAGIVTAALGADGGGSIRIPAAFTGLVGFKPTFGACIDEGGFAAMSPFCCPGPLAWRVADARIMLGVLAGEPLARGVTKRPLRVAWCPRPEGRPVDSDVAAAVARAVLQIAAAGHDVDETDLPIVGWKEAFGPLVLEEEGRLRGHLLSEHRDLLTDYEFASLEAAEALDASAVETAAEQHQAVIRRLDDFFDAYDLIVTPATAVPAFPVGERPRMIAGEKVDALWGPFPFTAAFNVAGTPAASIPSGFARGLPVGAQLVCKRGQDALLLDIAEDLEEALGIDNTGVIERFDASREFGAGNMTEPLRIDTAGSVATLTFDRPARLNALSYELLRGLRSAFERATAEGERVVILTGAGDCFSAGADISELTGTPEDAAFDALLADLIADIRRHCALVIAAIEGPCIGTALDLACACDLRVTAATAFLELPALRMGVLYNPAAVARMQRALPSATLRRLLLSGERIAGRDALAAGIATHVVSPSQALATARDIARAAVAGSPRALTETKRFLNALDDGAPDLDRWHTCRMEIFASPERAAALAAAKVRVLS